MLLHYPLGALVDISVVYNLQRLHLLSQQEVNGILRTNTEYCDKVIARMVSENIIRGEKNDFSKLITYLKSHSDIQYLVQYFEKKCMLLLVARSKINFKNITCPYKN